MQLARLVHQLVRSFAITASLSLTTTELHAQQPEQAPTRSAQEQIDALERRIRELERRDEGRAPSPSADNRAASRFPEVGITGFFQLDGGYFDQDTTSVATLGDIADGTGFRRARLAAAGRVDEDVSFIAEFDFAQAQGRFVDVWLQFDESPLGKIRIGRFRQPFGMSELTSIRELPFLERALTFPLSPFRQTGVMITDTALDERISYAVAGYSYLSDNFGNVFADSNGFGGTARITALPVDDGDTIVHVGADYSYNEPGRRAVQLASTNEFFNGQNPNLGPSGLGSLPIVAVPPFVNTGVMAARSVGLFNVEGAVSFGSLLFQAESRWAHVDLPGTTETFPASYGQVRWMLTGEKIPYSRSNGVFGRVRPADPLAWDGGNGAFELAVRVSHIDLNGSSLPGPGRRLTGLTTGLSWYARDRVRFQFNWIHNWLDDRTFGSSESDTFAFSAQLDF